MNRRLALVLIAAVTLAACHEAEPIGVPRTGVFAEPGADTVPGSGSLMELRAMKARWAQVRAGEDYAFRTAVSCFCMEERTRPVTIEVSGTGVTSVHEVATGAPRAPEEYWTIEELFERAIRERQQGGRVRVTYARSAGYPVWIEIGTPENDAGSWYSVSSVRLGAPAR